MAQWGQVNKRFFQLEKNHYLFAKEEGTSGEGDSSRNDRLMVLEKTLRCGIQDWP